MNKPTEHEKLLNQVEQFMRGRTYHPLTVGELLEKLQLPGKDKEVLKQVLDQLVKDGRLEVKKRRYAWMRSSDDVVTGSLSIHPRGFGFVQVKDPNWDDQDVFIPRHLTKNGITGDLVEVQVNLKTKSDKGPEGRVLTILQRARTHVAGIIKEVRHDGKGMAYIPMLGVGQLVVATPMPEEKLNYGDRVVMEVVDWGNKDSATYCQVTHYIGHISDASKDIDAAIEEFELRDRFPLKVLEEVRFFKPFSKKEMEGREDFTKIECVTIDPDTAKDFDDAITISKNSDGGYQLGVHIADVTHYVKPGTALDLEAQQRANSTYFPNVCLPMLPKELSENLCSLKPDEPRPAVSVMMELANDGSIISHRITRSVILSRKRFTYREAKEILDGKVKSPHEETLQLMVELCGCLKKQRYDRGSIEFAIPEFVIKIDESGVPTGTELISYDITHQMIEEFMLKANEIIATHLSKIGKSIAYRIHEEPSEDNMKDFAALAGAFGYNLNEKPSTRDLQLFFDEALQTSYGEYLATAFIRRMRLAVYSPHNVGHYGLGLSHYTHFTSPIRRYIDLLVHRVLLGEGDQDIQALERLASHCSEQERISAKAENSVILLKKLRLLDSYYKKEPQKQYEAIVTKVKHTGITFEVLDIMHEGFLHVSDLQDDYYTFDEKEIKLKGQSTGKSYFAGDKVTVIVKRIDFIHLETKWHLVGEERPNTKRVKKTFPQEKRGKNSGSGKGKGKRKSGKKRR